MVERNLVIKSEAAWVKNNFLTDTCHIFQMFKRTIVKLRVVQNLKHCNGKMFVSQLSSEHIHTPVQLTDTVDGQPNLKTINLL